MREGVARTFCAVSRLGAAAVAVALAASGCPGARPVGNASGRPATGSAAPPPVQQSLIVFAGAASKPALEELAASHEAQTGTKVELTFGGSGAVLTQFAQEHYGDVYVPGSDDFMDKAEQKGAVLAGTRTVLVHLVPVLCVPQGNPKQVRELADLTRKDLRVVIGEPQAVCLGAIAQEMLTQTGLWEKAKPRIVSYATSCEEVLNCLLLGEADAVVGWDVFARQHPDQVEAISLPPKLARTRNIPAAVIQWSTQPEAAKAFIRFLASEEAKQVFGKHGYTVKAPPAT